MNIPGFHRHKGEAPHGREEEAEPRHVVQLDMDELSAIFSAPRCAGVESRMGVPKPVARTVTTNVIRSLRGYFLGVTIVAAFNGVVVGLAKVAAAGAAEGVARSEPEPAPGMGL